ncbi:MAG: hypothetical protein ACQERB_07110 [Promethearchaeati archaeon]
MTSYKSAIKYLKKSFPDVMETAFISGEGKILYSNDKWSIKNDLGALLSTWFSQNGQYVNLNGIRYSILQMEPERFVATNRKKKGHLVGAATPSLDKFLIAHISPKSKNWFHGAYPTIARVAAMIQSGFKIDMKDNAKPTRTKHKKKIKESSLEKDYFTSFIGSENNQNTYLVQQNPQRDSYLIQEIENLLEWIKDPDGLAGFIRYYLSINDSIMISKLSEIYQRFYKIFYE